MTLLVGALVRLAPVDVEIVGDLYPRWRTDTEYWRLLDGGPPILISPKQARDRAEEFKPNPVFQFHIRRIEDDKPIGFLNVWTDWPARDAWIGIGIGEREERGKGYGSEAMQLALRFGFGELELERMTLMLWADNLRALKSYQKAGFVIEGTTREEGLRDGRRWDGLVMGILRAEWLAKYGKG